MKATMISKKLVELGLNPKNYRIIEKTFADGHKEYTAQECWLNFGILKFWKNMVCDTWDYGYARVNFLCCGKTYNACKVHLIETLEKKVCNIKNTKIIKIRCLL